MCVITMGGRDLRIRNARRLQLQTRCGSPAPGRNGHIPAGIFQPSKNRRRARDRLKKPGVGMKGTFHLTNKSIPDQMNRCFSWRKIGAGGDQLHGNRLVGRVAVMAPIGLDRLEPEDFVGRFDPAGVIDFAGERQRSVEIKNDQSIHY